MIIVVSGPTGVGKTKLSVSLAKLLNAEVINGDSVQIYKGLDIGSAKVKEEEKDGIEHHLFDITNLSDDYSIYDYQIDCRNKIKEIESKNKNIIIVGGTGLYIKSALYDYTISDNIIHNDYSSMSTDDIYNELIKIDKDIIIDRYNRKRLERALDYYKSTGKSIKSNNNGNNLLYDTVFIGLTMDRDKLYDRINNRVDKMIRDGLIDEVRNLYKKNKNARILGSAIGYKELIKYFNGELSLEEAIELIKRKSRRYAKRQYTFFNHQFNMNWFNVDIDNFDNTIKEVYEFIKGSNA